MSYAENMISNLGYCESLNYRELSSNSNCMDILKKYCNLGYNIFDNACLNYTNAYIYANKFNAVLQSFASRVCKNSNIVCSVTPPLVTFNTF